MTMRNTKKELLKMVVELGGLIDLMVQQRSQAQDEYIEAAQDARFAKMLADAENEDLKKENEMLRTYFSEIATENFTNEN